VGGFRSSQEITNSLSERGEADLEGCDREPMLADRTLGEVCELAGAAGTRAATRDSERAGLEVALGEIARAREAAVGST
jgi:hypothetical protein